MKHKDVKSICRTTQTYLIIKKYFLVVLLLFSSGVLSQESDNKWTVSVGINAVDVYPAGLEETTQFYPQGELFEDFFNVSDHWNFGGPTVSISRLIYKKLTFGIEMSLNKIKKIEGESLIDHPYYSGNIFVKKVFDTNKKINPYLKLGYGITGIDRGLFGGENLMFSEYFSETIEPGFGLQISLKKKIGLEISSSFVNAIETTGISHFRHQATMYVGLGTNDKDKDGIINRKDKCPDAAGDISNFGCPDSDEDGLIDIEDSCPEQAGPLDNNGCPLVDENQNQTTLLVSETLSLTESSTSTADKEDSFLLENKNLNQLDLDIEEKNQKIKSQGLNEILSNELVVYFPASKAIILGRKALDLLLEIRDHLDSNLEKFIIIEGHSSNDGGEEYNIKLSLERANSVKNHLINLGISSDRIKTFGFGSKKPMSEENSERDRLLNRRVEIRFQ